METLNQPRNNGTKYLWIGPVLGIACMAGLFIYGLVGDIPQLLVMSSSLAAMLGAIWASTTAAAKKKARR